MCDLPKGSFSPEDFGGQVRLFPLPNLVMFPHVMQPLHIFEGRYRHLVKAALADDRMITMATLQPGWEKDYEGRPAVSPVACLGQVVTYHQLQDGRYNLLLVGVGRVHLIREFSQSSKFREAEAELLEDIYPTPTEPKRHIWEERLLEAFIKRLGNASETHCQLEQLAQNSIPLGMLTDVIGHALDLKLEFKQRLLSERNVDRRAELLLERLEMDDSRGALPAARVPPFPPAFSNN